MCHRIYNQYCGNVFRHTNIEVTETFLSLQKITNTKSINFAYISKKCRCLAQRLAAQKSISSPLNLMRSLLFLSLIYAATSPAPLLLYISTRLVEPVLLRAANLGPIQK